MATIIVANTNDSGVGSLRQAVLDAAAGDTIVFAAGGTVTLTSELVLNKDITINGDVDGDRKADITISGNDATRIFNVTGAGTELNLRSLTLTDGNAAGDVGGAVWGNNGTIVTVIDSTIADSAANYGGGIYAGGTLQVIDSTITGNAANLYGGGVLLSNGDATFINTTIHDNEAGTNGAAGIDASNFSTLTILNSTITENTSSHPTFGAGGIFLSATSTATIRNSVIAENTGALAADAEFNGAATAGSSFFGTTVTIATNEGGNINNGGDPLLGALADNGGPVETRMPEAGSQLIGAGNAALLPADTFDLDGDGNATEALPIDARGAPRVFTSLDIGATERVLIVTNTNDSGGGSLRQAILDANANPDHDTIVFASSLAGQTITLSSQLALTTDITINGDLDGDRKADITISGNDATRILDINGSGVEVELRSLTLTGGNPGVGGRGGAIQVATGADLSVIDSTLAGGAGYEGGGIYASNATLRVINSTISGNNTSSWGAGLRALDSTTTLVNTTIYDNTAGGGGGGAIDASGTGSLTILNSTIIDNASGLPGFGIYASSTVATTIRNSVVAGSTPAGSEIRAGDLTAGWNFFGATVIITTDEGGNINNGGDPLLGTFDYHGGPVQTLAILPGSPLIGAGNAALLPADTFDLDGDGNTAELLSLDAHGVARVNGALDIGAFESNAAPELTGVTSPVTFAENTVNAAPQLLDADVTFTDPDSNFDGGTLVVSGLLAEDSVSIRNQGNAAGQIGFGAGTVSFGGTAIGTVTGGAGATLTVTFNASATSAAIDALIQNLTYANSSDTPTASRTLIVNVTDAAGANTVGDALFAVATGTDNPLNGVSVGSYNAPVLVDFDGDGDLDAALGAGAGHIDYFINTGTASAPVFVHQPGAASPFDGVNGGIFATPTFGDIDDDGDLDLLLGNYDGVLKYFENTGTASAPAFTERTGVSNPFNGIDVGYWSAPVLVDLDGDGDLDAAIGSNYGTVAYLENTGTASAPIFTTRNGAANPFNGIDIGYDSRFSFVDFDKDGDLDVVAGNRPGTLFYLENTGTASAPAFTERSGAANPFDGINVGPAAAPTAADIDGDGDIDVFVGTNRGDAVLLVNRAEEGARIVVNVTAQNDAPVLTDVTSPVTFAENTVNATPQLLDADVTFTDPEGNFNGGTLVVSGLLAEDAVSIRNQGNGAGQIGFSGSTVSFGGTAIGTATGGAGATLTVTFNASATSAAIDALIENLTYANASDTPTASRTLTITVTDAAGDATTHPSFAQATGGANPFNGIAVGGFSTPALADLDGDGDLDAVVGNQDPGTLDFFLNTGSATAPVYVQQTGSANPFDGIGVGRHSTSTFGDLDGDGDLDAVVGAEDGTLRYFLNTGSASAPVFTAQTGAANPFDGIDIGTHAAPLLADLDGDGDLDAVVGRYDGTISFFLNTGSSTAPVFSAQTGSANPFDGIDVSYTSKIAAGDVDGDGDLDVVLGNNEGTLRFLLNTGSATAPVFTEQTGSANPFNGFHVGFSSAPSLVDLDDDGDLDAVVGSLYDGVFYFVNTPAAGVPIVVNVTAESDIGVTIIGTKNGDLVDASNTAPGQPLPTDVNDIILGNKGDDDLSGLGGHDTIDGGKGDDTLRGGGGNDILQVKGQEGTRDVFDGGTGNDTLQFLGTGNTRLAGFDATASSIEIILGNGKAITGTQHADAFDFSGLTAMTNVSFVDGGGGDDTLIGSTFGDDLRGGGGADTLDGGAGNDVLTGGGGRDTFVFTDGYGADTVRDYQKGVDIFDFTGVAGVHAFGDLFLTQLDKNTVLIDFDGVAGGDTLTVQKTTIAALTANQGDFVFA